MFVQEAQLLMHVEIVEVSVIHIAIATVNVVEKQTLINVEFAMAIIHPVQIVKELQTVLQNLMYAVFVEVKMFALV